MGRVDEVLVEMRRERESLVLELARVDRVIAALEATTAPAVVSGAPDAGPAQPALPPGIAKELDGDRRRASGRGIQDAVERLGEHRSWDVAAQRREIHRDFRHRRRQTLVRQAKNQESKGAEAFAAGMMDI